MSPELLGSINRYAPDRPNQGCCVGGALAKKAPEGPHGCGGAVVNKYAFILVELGNILSSLDAPFK
jgi:hypothetical protein